LTALSTHDTKRSEDVRARINLLSEMPDEWRACVEQWAGINQHEGPTTRNDEYLVYQTLIGAWPLDGKADDAFVERIVAYMRKAMREAKVNTSWTAPNTDYESAVEQFIGRTIRSDAFLESFLPFQRRVADLAQTSMLAQTLLRLTVPGVPDTYQGTELIDLSLVDPDNRRPVDYARRQAWLTQPEQDRKFLVTLRALHARRAHPGLFSTGGYTPIRAAGPRAEQVFAFARQDGPKRAVVVVPRLVARGGDFAQTMLTLPPMHGRNVFTGKVHDIAGEVAVADLLGHFPVALLLPER
jgi:(1->4)-alpha-D-glucan 1-alpha-D-glucosylmutase